MRKSRLQKALILLASLSMVLVSGCSSLPRSGAVRSFTPENYETGNLIQSARGPVQDSSPEVLVRDFLRACAAGNFDDYAKAKLYLTDQAVAQWKPNALVNVIRADSGPNIANENGVVRISAGLDSKVSGDGVRTLASPGTVLNQQMVLKKNADGQWRIDKLDPGIIIPLGTFEIAYARRALYFPTPDLEDLVPDPRWYPRRDIAVHLVQGLLKGPNGDIKAAVKNFIPAGTKLLTNSIDIESGRATVTLSEGVLKLSPKAQSEVYRQFARTLMGVTQISAVQLQAGETIIGGGSNSVPAKPYDLSTLVGFDVKGNLVSQSSTDTPQIVLNNAASLPLYGATTSPVHPGAVFARKGNIQIVRIGAKGANPVVIFRGADLTDPSVDRRGWIWTASEDNPKQVFAILPGERTYKIPVEADTISSSATIKDIKISVDGARAAVVFQDKDEILVRIFAVQRDDAGSPTALKTPVPVVLDLLGFDSLSWVGQTTLGIFGETKAVGSTSNSGVFQVQIGGGIHEIVPPRGANWVVGGSSNGLLVVSDPKGNMYSRSGNSWRSLTTVMVHANYPG